VIQSCFSTFGGCYLQGFATCDSQKLHVTSHIDYEQSLFFRKVRIFSQSIFSQSPSSIPHFSRGHLFFKANARRTLRKNTDSAKKYGLCEKIGTARSLFFSRLVPIFRVVTPPSSPFFVQSHPPRSHFSRGHLFFKANARQTLRKNTDSAKKYGLCEKKGTARSLKLNIL